MKIKIFTAMLLCSASASVMGQNVASVPKLVVGITIDRMRSDYLEAFSPLYGEGGFKRLMNNGIVYSNVENYLKAL